MSHFTIFLYDLIKSPVAFVQEKIEEAKDLYLLSSTFFIIILVSSAQFIGFMNYKQMAADLSIFSFIMLMALYISIFFLSVFIESSVTTFFLKNRNVTPYPFGSKQVFTLVSLSYFPYLFLPAASIFSRTIRDDIYILFIIVAFVWMLQVRKTFFEQYTQFFNLSPWILVAIPVLMQVVLSILQFIFIGSSLALLLSDIIQEYVGDALGQAF